MISCMGGWCAKRELCQYYEPAELVFERLCELNEYDCFIKCIKSLSLETQMSGHPSVQSSKETPRLLQIKEPQSD